MRSTISHGQKRCTKCGQFKSLDLFSPHPQYRDKGKYLSWCKTCYASFTRSTKLRISYKITEEEYQQKLLSQNNVCASCGLPETKKSKGSNVIASLAVDHDHVTGQVRGLLCSRCNMALGLLNDDPERIEALTRYIRKYK